MPRTKFISIGVLLGFITVAPAQTWQPLFNGADLSGWKSYLARPSAASEVSGLKRDEKGNYLEAIGEDRDPLKVFSVTNVDGSSAIHISGEVFGTITTTNLFDNFHLRLQFKWGEKRWAPRTTARRDSGILYWGHGPLDGIDGFWPRSSEFQIQEHDTGDLWAVGIRTKARAKKQGNNRIYDPQGEENVFIRGASRCIKLEDAEKPRGEWNTLDLICLNGDSIHIVNGKVVMRLSNAERVDGPIPTPLRTGTIGLQSEGAEVYYRNVEIRPISEVAAEFRP
jgi:hypothetical protein